jgi:hypothetical protein
MSPWELLLWVLAVGLSVVIVAIVVFMVVAIVRSIAAPVKGKGSGGR